MARAEITNRTRRFWEGMIDTRGDQRRIDASACDLPEPQPQKVSTDLSFKRARCVIAICSGVHFLRMLCESIGIWGLSCRSTAQSRWSSTNRSEIFA